MEGDSQMVTTRGTERLSGLRLVIPTLLMALLAACGGTQTASPAATSAPAAAKATAPAPGAAVTTAPAPGAAAQGKIQIAVVAGAMRDTMLKLADKFKAEHPGTEVEVINEPEGGAFEALIAAGNQPDIIT